MGPEVHRHGVTLPLEGVDPMQHTGGEQHQPVANRGNGDHRVDRWQCSAVARLNWRVVGHQQFATGAAHVGIEHRRELWQLDRTAALSLGLVFVDVPVEVVVGLYQLFPLAI